MGGGGESGPGGAVVGEGGGGSHPLATTCRCLSSTERELFPLSRPRLPPCLTPTLHLPVAALQALQQVERKRRRWWERGREEERCMPRVPVCVCTRDRQKGDGWRSSLCDRGSFG